MQLKMANALHKKLCDAVEEAQKDSDFRKVEKVLAPFMRTLKKKKLVKADVMPEEFKELYLNRSPKELLSRLQTSFSDPLKVKTLLNETAELLKVVTASKSVNLYLADYNWGEIILCPQYVANNDRFEKRYRIETGTYLACHVAFSREYVISDDVLADERFPQGIPGVSPMAKAAICIPIITNVEETCIGVLELYRLEKDPPYDLVNLQICTALTAWMGIAIEQNSIRLNLLKEMEIQSELSELADLYFSGVIPFGKIVSDIIKITKTAVCAEKGAFYVFHEPIQLNAEHVLSAETYEEGYDEVSETIIFKKRNKTRFVKNEPGVPGYAARSWEVVNVHDAYKDRRFNRATDTASFRTRAVVGFPIKNCHGVLAVLKLVNNMKYPHFRKEDIELINSYLNYVGLVCDYFLLDTHYTKMQLRMITTNKLLDFHTKPPPDEIVSMRNFVQAEHPLPPGFSRFEWDSCSFEEDAHKFIALAFLNSDILEYCFDFQNLADFLLRVKKAHRPVLFHNFEHSFYSFHFAYNVIGRNRDYFNTAEAITVLLAALCHDVDHEGLTNSFISLKNDATYKLYGDFCGEAHRYETVMFLIQSTDLLSNASSQIYQGICKSLKRLMLSMDVAIHFQNRKKIVSLLNANAFDWENPEHRHLAQSMVLMVSDHSVWFKSFDLVKKFTSCLYKEMYRQGDLEKSMGFSPLPLMDRNNTEAIPQNQIILMTTLSVPSVEVLVSLMPNLSELNDILNQTIVKWREIIALKGQELWKLNQALLKDKKEKKSPRITLSSNVSSLRSLFSDYSKTERYNN